MKPDVNRKRKELAELMGLEVCPYGANATFCPYQESYSIVKGIPTSTNDVAFLCLQKGSCSEVTQESQE